MHDDIRFFVEIVSFFAGLLCTISLVPQILKLWRERNPQAISLPMYLIVFTGVSLWFCVGVLLESYAMMFWNGLTMTFQMAVIAMKIRFNREEAKRTGNFVSSRHLP